MGKVILSGIVPPLEYTAPIKGILASDLAIGSSVYLMENGVAVEYLVVNHGIPSGSSLYDTSCDGTWLLRKECYDYRQMNQSISNAYENSNVQTFLDGDFFNSLGTIEQSTIRQVKIPYRQGSGSSSTVVSGSNGLSTKVFLLSGYEVGFTTEVNSKIPVDGAKLDYFESGDTSGGTNRSKRIAYYSGSTASWWLRSPYFSQSDTRKWMMVEVYKDGQLQYTITTNYQYSRPALIVPKTALFDKNTMLLKGVS